ncbi:MAG: Maf family protein [Pseudobutyrivibrio sp.]|nr:Maf family protein [Pseudobutyrivibrio sp.]
MKLILASGSPRRRELLAQAGIEYIVEPADIEETTTETLPARVVEDLSRQKALAVSKNHPGQVVLAADTVVAFDDKILGKPVDEDDAFEMLTELSGRTHQVYTGVTIVYTDRSVKTFSECTEVTMYPNSPEAIRSYIASGEPMDKAGAYGIQGLGSVLVERINGDYNNVVGLPLAKVYRELK